MSNNRTRDDFLRFLDYLGEKGLIPSTTAASRKATANKVLAILSPDEADDVTVLDIDPLMRRFHNLNPQQYTPESLQTYKSRMRTALEDFRIYCENPIGFKPTSQGKIRSKSMAEKSASNHESQLQDESSVITSTLPNISVLPIAIRAGLTIQIVGLPFDLTSNEAQKIANIVLAHSV